MTRVGIDNPEHRCAFILKGGVLRAGDVLRPFELWGIWGHFFSFERAEGALAENCAAFFRDVKVSENGAACIYEVPEGFWFARSEVWYRASVSGAEKRERPSWLGTFTL